MQPNYTPGGVKAMIEFYRRNRTPEETMSNMYECERCMKRTLSRDLIDGLCPQCQRLVDEPDDGQD